MPLKLDDNGQAVLDNGNVVWVYDDGRESAFDIGSTLNNIKTLTGESVSRKKKIQEMEARYAPFKDIENPEDFLTKAQKALETVSNFNDKDYVAVGEVEKLKRGVSEGYETKMKELEKGYKTQLDERESMLKAKDAAVHNLLVRGAFLQSDYLKNNVVTPTSAAFAELGRHFKVEEVNGELKAVAVRSNGDKIFSNRSPGTEATPDEALEILINEREDKDSWLRGNPGGSGTQQSTSTNNMSMTELLKLSPEERLNAARRKR